MNPLRPAALAPLSTLIHTLTLASSLALAASLAAADYKVPLKDLGFPVYKNNPPGKQLIGDTVRAAASDPARHPEESRKLIQVPPGFEVRLFASEPEVVNPVAMTWDERGRLWVLELYEYPRGAKPGTKPRDRIKILEDTDGDGTADKVTVFADGFDLATGLALGNGGVYLGAAPNLYFLEDTNAVANGGVLTKANKITVLKTGFGLEDRHELLNGFAWGPDGWLYMTHGVFTHSKVKDPNNPDDPGVKVDAALARFHPRTKKFEVFADGTSNPWGVDWNERGDAFVSACVIQHLFHMAPGGLYNRQGGTWPNPYGYVQDLPTKGLPAVVDWRHYRAAHAGICIYQGDQFPPAWRGLVFLGNIHQNALNCDRLTPVGATYTAQKETKLLGADQGIRAVGAGNFLVSQDQWFRPLSVQTGPDGALWIADWCDKYPCYQNAQADPEGVDREHGRIWRVVWVGNEKGKKVATNRLPPWYVNAPKTNLLEMTTVDLVFMLGHSNSWHVRKAHRVLTERLLSEQAPATGRLMMHAVGRNTWAGGAFPTRAEAAACLQTAFSAGLLTEQILDRPQAELPGFWMGNAQAAARITGERGLWNDQSSSRLLAFATNPDASVRAATASALRQFTSGSLTVDTPAPASAAKADLLPHFRELLARPSVPGDTYYPHIVWMAMEPRVAADPQPFFPLLAASDNSITAYCMRRTMRRICDLTDATARAQHLDAAMEFLATLTAKPALAEAALDGLIDSFKSKGQIPTANLAPIFAKLTAVPALADKARRLATLLGDTSSAKLLIAKINDSKAPLADRLNGIQAAREAKTDAARDELVKLLKTPLTPALSPSEGARVPGVPPPSSLAPAAGERAGVRGPSDPAQQLLTETLRALSTFSGDQLAYDTVDAWKNFSPATRRTAAEVLVTRTKWARALLAGVDQKAVAPVDISATARRALARSDDSTVVAHADRVLGKYRAPDADKLKLIAAKRAVVLAGTPDVKAGQEVARKLCYVCHKLYGEGGDVGPDLTGVGRSTLDALLHNVIDPNEVIGNGFEATEVELQNGTVLTGRIIEDSPTRLKLLAAGPTEHALARSDIAVANGKPKIRTLQSSLMPEGLEQMPDKEFRDLIWFLLNPPQDNRPWTPALRKELLGDETAGQPKKSAANFPPIDRESVALWNPDWRVTAPDFEGTPAKLVEFAGQRNVLLTHPFDREKPAALERELTLPAGQKTTLKFLAAAHEKGDWELRVLANGKLLLKQLIARQTSTVWQPVTLDLTPLAGQKITLRLENAANGWSHEFGYWTPLELKSERPTAAR